MPPLSRSASRQYAGHVNLQQPRVQANFDQQQQLEMMQYLQLVQHQRMQGSFQFPSTPLTTGTSLGTTLRPDEMTTFTDVRMPGQNAIINGISSNAETEVSRSADPPPRTHDQNLGGEFSEPLNSGSSYGDDMAKAMEYDVIQEVDRRSAEGLESPSTRACAVWKRPSPSEEKFTTRKPRDLDWKRKVRMRHKAALAKHQDPSERQAYLSALTEDYVKFCYNLHDVHDELRNKPSVKRTYDLEKRHTRWSYDGNNLTPYEIGGNSSSTEWLDANALWEKQRLRTWQQQYCLEGNASRNGTGGDGTTS
jgi:hypothetical protein